MSTRKHLKTVRVNKNTVPSSNEIKGKLIGIKGDGVVKNKSSVPFYARSLQLGAATLLREYERMGDSAELGLFQTPKLELKIPTRK